MKTKLIDVIKSISGRKIFSGILAISTLLGGYVAVVDIWGEESDELPNSNLVSELTTSEKPRSNKLAYEKDWIPITYGSLDEFRAFLEQGTGKVVSIHSSFSLNAVHPESFLLHDVCKFDDFIDTVVHSPDKISDVSLGLPYFVNSISDEQWQKYSETGEYTSEMYRAVNCMDQIRLVVKDPRSLRFSYGGTGTISLPIFGDFLIEKRALSGPRIEYTLREM
ncbi:hypothetical protein V8049_004317 [Vibrio vulnificus]|nr:hypothetical protein [Vibrio vulnificus]EJV9424564.1 hypothetical protein [Vibrio vulnificus]